MPSITAYTPFETLKICQSIAQHEASPNLFEDIAQVLNANELIRDSTAYDAQRLSPTALQSLYHDLLAGERGGSPKVNGETAAESSISRKRKASSSPGPENGNPAQSDDDLLHALVDKLYARFREEIIKEIRKDEEDYEQLHNEIKELETRPQSASTQPEPSEQSTTPRPQHKRQPSRTDVSALVSPHDETPAYSRQGQEERMQEQSGSRPSSNSEGKPSVPSIPPVVPSQHSPALSSARLSAEPVQPPLSTPNLNQSPAAFSRTLPPPSPQRAGFPPTHHPYPPGPQGHLPPILPPPTNMPPHMSPHMEYPNPKRSSATSTPARGSPVPPPQPPYQPYPPYPQQAAPWPQAYPPHQQHYPPHMQYPAQPYYAQPPAGRPPYHSPHQSPYPPYPPHAQGHYPGHPAQGWYQSPQPPQQVQSVSAASTPLSQTGKRRSLIRSSGSSTPWKKTPLKPGQQRPTSPSRPDRDISPISDFEKDNQRSRLASTRSPSRPQQTPTDETKSSRTSRRGRPVSATPSGVPESRSQSVVSHRSETPTERPATRRAQAIKDEAPSTPLASSDAEQGRSTRRGRPRNATATSVSRPDLSQASTAQKRKRSPPPTAASSVTLPLASSASSTPSTLKPPTQPVAPNAHPIHAHSPDLVLVSKNFAKTSQLVLNEITSHKLAGIFAKPLSERDAPGYRELVLRPQDLKTTKTAVGKGSRAAVAAVEALEAADEESAGSVTATPTKRSSAAAATNIAPDSNDEKLSKEGPLGNGMYLVTKTLDLAPPKGIVNSSQLEMEVTRMFANAVMFNPLPTDERGFGRSLRIRKFGGDVHASGKAKKESTTDNSTDKDEKEADDDENEDEDDENDGSDDGESEQTSSSSSSSSSDTDAGGGIIADAREMFADVMDMVRRWRDVEVERITGKNPSSSVSAGLGQGSTSSGAGVLPPQQTLAETPAQIPRNASLTGSMSMSVADEEGGMSTPTAGGAGEGEGEGMGTGTTRKRRRINEG